MIGLILIPNPQSPIPNPQSPIPNPQSPIPNPQNNCLIINNIFLTKKYFINYYLFCLNLNYIVLLFEIHLVLLKVLFYYFFLY